VNDVENPWVKDGENPHSVVVRQKAQYSLGKSKVVTERSDSVTTPIVSLAFVW